MDTNTTGGTAGTTTTQTGGVKQELASDAKTIGEAARGKVEEKAAAGKEQATQAARETSSALNTAVDALREKGEAPEWLTKGLDRAAREIDKLAGSFEGKDMRAITSDVTAFARKNPGAFLAASAAIGFVAARFLRAGSDYGAHQGNTSAGGTGGARLYGSTGGGSGAYGSYDEGTSGGQGSGTDRSTFSFAGDQDEGMGSSTTTGTGTSTGGGSHGQSSGYQGAGQ